VDYQLLLLALADEYLEAAHSSDMLAALAKGDAQLDEYYKLVSTALGCMETVLKKFRILPVKEATLRLHFARTLYEETDNDLEAETALSKGIDLCERNKFLDLKYTMQVLLSRVLYRSNTKAAIKAIDKFIEDVAAYKHAAWEYTFRFLRANLSLKMETHQDFVAAVHHLQKTADLAHRRGDHAVFAFANVTEALAHLQSSSSDSIDQAQRALAATRQVQLSQDVNSVPQIQVLVQYVDLCSSLKKANPQQIDQKLSEMQQVMDQIVDDPNWLDDGCLYLPLMPKSAQGVASMGGDIVKEKNGRPVLALTWLPKRDLYSIGYLLSAIASSHKNAQGNHKAELCLDEGLELSRRSLNTSKLPSESLSSSTDRKNWRRMLECQFLLEKAFFLCARSEWENARNVLSEVNNIGEMLQTQLSPDFRSLYRYLHGTICQGTGNLTKALTIFRSKDLALPPDSNKTSHNNLRRDIALLAAINAILIIRSPDHPSHHLLPTILSAIDPYLSVSPNKHLLASRSLLISNLSPSTHNLLTTESLSSTLLIKKHLSTALNIAKTIGNAQITAMTLSVMSAKFFKGVVGEQAEKSARAGQNMAYKSGMKLWMSVSNGMLAETLERQGKREEAERVRQAAVRMAGQMPRAVQRFEREEAGSAGVGGEKKAVNEGGDDDEKDELA
jgi:Cohesin loading factor